METQDVLNQFFDEIEEKGGIDKVTLNHRYSNLEDIYKGQDHLTTSESLGSERYNPTLNHVPKTLPILNSDDNKRKKTSYHQQTIANTKNVSISTGHQTSHSSKPNTFYVREIAGKKWIDSSLIEWPINDHRLFVGNLSKDVTDEILAQHFAQYPSLAKTRVIRDKYTKAPKGYGFVSFLDVTDFSRALKQMEGTYIINRPCKLSVSTWNKRNYAIVKNGKFQKQDCTSSINSVQPTYSRGVLSKINKNKYIGGVPNFVLP